MAYNPYFRYGSTSLDLLGIQAPGFPVAHGGRYHTYALSNPEYTTTQRYHGSTQLQWATEGIQKSDRDTIWAFWNTTLSAGYNNMTVIDSRGRMLFDTSWNAWSQNWRKERGGIYRINYGLESPVVWTPPCFGCFPSTTNSLVNHNLSGDDLTLDDGAMVDYGTDSNVLRKTGYALRIEGLGGPTTGATGAVSWKSGNAHNSLSLFCQIRPREYSIDPIALIKLAAGTGEFSLWLDLDNNIYGYINNGGSTATVTKADASSPNLTDGIWYDVALTYDSVNSDVHVYYAVSATSSFTDFLSGETDMENGIISTLSSAVYPPDVTWTECSLLKNTAVTGYYYLQNAFIFDDFLTPAEFNTMRRLCWQWNNKTTGNHPA